MWEGIWQIIFVLWLLRRFFWIVGQMTGSGAAENRPDSRCAHMEERVETLATVRLLEGWERGMEPEEKLWPLTEEDEIVSLDQGQ